MNKEFDESLLSAYLDGELSGVQRHEVEEHLRRSPQARQTLKELGEVSALLRALPSESLSEQFPRRVLQAVQQQPLPPSSKSAGPKRVVWWMGAGAAAAAAVAWLFLFPRPSEPIQVAQVPKPAPSSLLVDPASPVAPKTEKTVGVRSGPSLESRDQLEQRGKRAMRRDRSPMLYKGHGNASEVAGAQGFQLENSPEAELQKDQGNATHYEFFDVKTMEAGNVVKALKTAGDRVTVVEVTVVDVRKGLEEIQVLFTGARPLGANAEDGDDPDAVLMNTVFVRSDREAIRRSLETLQKLNPELFVSLAIDRKVPKPLRRWIAMQKDKFIGEDPTKSKKETDESALGEQLPRLSREEDLNRKFAAKASRSHREPKHASTPQLSMKSRAAKGAPLNVFFRIRQQDLDPTRKGSKPVAPSPSPADPSPKP